MRTANCRIRCISSSSKRPGIRPAKDHLKVFADAAEKWLAENDPEGVAFEYGVLE